MNGGFEATKIWESDENTQNNAFLEIVVVIYETMFGL